MPTVGGADVGRGRQVASYVGWSRMRPTPSRPISPRREGGDVGLLLLRLPAGGLLFGHAAQNLFGWFGQSRRPPEIEEFRDLGYRPATFFARLAGTSELIASILLATGAATPLGGALTAATTVQAIQSAKWQNGLWEQDGGYEYLLLLAASGATLAFAGPGRYSADARLGWDLSGRAAGFAAAAAAAISLILPHHLPGWPDDSSTTNDAEAIQ
jgi:putative oxidoreductase